MQNHIVSLNISNNSRVKKGSLNRNFNNNNNNNVRINPDITTTPTTTITNFNGCNMIKLNNLSNQFTTILIDNQSQNSLENLIDQNNKNDGLNADRHNSEEFMNSTYISNDSNVPFVNI